MTQRLTAIIQIGNSDDKLTQREWASFCHAVHLLLPNQGLRHFSGFSAPNAAWQNACFVVETHAADLHSIRNDLRELAERFNQDSIALTIGETEFVTP